MPKIVEDKDIYQAVLQVVIDRGYAGATTKQMALAANVSEVTLFRKYESKLQLVRRAISALFEQIDFEAATLYSGKLEADLLRVVQTYQGMAVKHGQFFAVILSEFNRYPGLAESFDRPVSMFHKIEQLIGRYQEEGQLREESPLYAVSGLLGPLMYSTMLRRAMSEDRFPPIDLVEHVNNFIHGHKG